MQIQVSTDRTIPSHEAVALRVEDDILEALRRFNSSIERVEVHLAAEPGDSMMRCSIEARLSGRAPTKVVHRAATLDVAVSGAAAELMKALEGALGRRPLAPAPV